MSKQIHIFGGGTFSYVRSHLALAAPAFGETARQLDTLFRQMGLPTQLHLTRMADPVNGTMVTTADVAAEVDAILADLTPCTIIFNTAIVDYDGQIGDVPSGKHAKRMHSRQGGVTMELTPSEKILARIRKTRKDIFLIGFKTTCGATADEMYLAGLEQVKRDSVNLTFVNDVLTRLNMVVTPEEARYGVTADRNTALDALVSMVAARHSLRFTRSTVVEGAHIPWNSPEIPGNLRQVIDHCIARGAYKPFRGVTAGHFAVNMGNGVVYTSERKTDFNKLAENGLIRIVAQGDDAVIATGGKPSVGGQSQRIIFRDHADKNLRCIAHFHAPLRTGAPINTVPQWPFECGSHECGQNTSNGLREVEDGIWAVYLDHHGPNIVFRDDVPAERVIKVIEDNFDLTLKTGGSVAQAA